MRKLSKPTWIVLAGSITFLVLVGVLYFFNQGYFLGRNPFPSGDEPDYLIGALKIKEYGGPHKFISYLISGSYTEGRKHPLYMFLLSFFAVKDLKFFVYAKFINLLIGGVLLATSYFVMRRLFNTLSAVYFTLILALNEDILWEIALVVPDVLMMLFVLLSCYFYYLGFMRKGRSANMYWILGSIFTGLTYLTKPNGIILFGIFVLTSIFILKKRIVTAKSFYLAISTFFIIISPLLIRNIILYKNPFFNDNVSLLWIENRQERRSPEFSEKPPNVISYLSNKGIINEIKLYGENAVKMASNFSTLALFGQYQWRYSFPLLFFALVSMLLDKDKKRAGFLAGVFIIFYLFFAYNYRVSPHYRHIMPIIFIPIGFISLLVGRISQEIYKKKPVFLYSLILIVVGFTGIYLGYTKLSVEKRLSISAFEGQIDLPEVYVVTKDWLLVNIQPGDAFVMGLDDDFMFTWYADIQGKRIVQPYFSSFEEFDKFLSDNRVKYVVLGGQTVNSFPEIYSDYFVKRKNTPNYIIVNKSPTNWEVVFKFPKENTKNYTCLIYDVSGLWQ